jgi:hypothetical protein
LLSLSPDREFRFVLLGTAETHGREATSGWDQYLSMAAFTRIRLTNDCRPSQGQSRLLGWQIRRIYSHYKQKQNQASLTTVNLFTPYFYGA